MRGQNVGRSFGAHALPPSGPTSRPLRRMGRDLLTLPTGSKRSFSKILAEQGPAQPGEQRFPLRGRRPAGWRSASLAQSLVSPCDTAASVAFFRPKTSSPEVALGETGEGGI
ncbi:hypothetical protein DPEC_G00038150 [Dallia pectoralis]|uniref:Uncharacterized protein n=1 Tax=Dallia pectoralis TaxID=75939 RepID=A0ACC2HE91_DALPE|nr:hypothetical protein DPEC_G00038150 [Dallia pectoralis]